ncbi:hypothetical protein [Bradyrhizobium sp. USDA 4353]
MSESFSHRATVRIGAALLLCWTWLNPARAETVASAYTSAAEKDCRTIGKPDNDSSTQSCPGKDGLIVLVTEGDLRQTVSVGRTISAAAKEPAAQTWFGPFNSAGKTIEWRMADGKPFAIIQRWQIADNDDQGKKGPKDKPLLVVTRLPPGPVCHVAYVDAAANANANELARQAADASARSFACGKDKVKVLGTRGRAIDLALP